MSHKPAHSRQKFPIRAQVTGAARVQCDCGHVSRVKGLQPGVWLFKCWGCERTRAIGLAFYDLPAGPRMAAPCDLAIPGDLPEMEVDALPGCPPNDPGEAMPKVHHDQEMWFPARPVTQHILEDGERENKGRTPRVR